MRVSEIAIDFYIERPLYIQLIQVANLIGERDLRLKTESVFRGHFMEVFGDVDGSGLRFPLAQVLDMVGWLLKKTRDDFLAAYGRGGSPAALKRSYLSEWRFYLEALRRGIYGQA
jgi:hypothetical protein